MSGPSGRPTAVPYRSPRPPPLGRSTRACAPPPHCGLPGLSHVKHGPCRHPGPPAPPPPTPPSWTAIFKEHLDPQLRWRIYTDSSWRVAPTPTPDDFFLEPGTHQGGGLHHLYSGLGLPMTMELLAISAGLELLDALSLSGTVCSDCQGLVKKLLHPHALRRTPATAGFPLIRACARRVRHPSRQLQRTRSHPERSGTPRSGWDQSQWGIFLADHYARSPTSPPPGPPSTDCGAHPL